MTKIALTVEGPTDVTRIVSAVRSVTGRSVGDIARSAQRGEPIAEFVLFGGDHTEVARQLRRLVSELPRAGGVVRAYELDDAESLASVSDPNAAEIPLETMANILESHEREIARQARPSEEER